jgi:uncharacterized protein (TIGR02246 family)
MKRYPLQALFLFVVVASIPASFAGDKEDIAQATRTWAEAMSARDAERVLALYAPDAVLWGTRSPSLRATPETVREYFGILKTVPASYRATLGEQHIRVYGDTAINSGTYTFSQVDDGKDVLRPARFSFVYRKSGNRWLIVDHHSSAVPAAPVPAAAPK